MENQSISLEELTQLYKGYIKLSDRPRAFSREESKGKEGKLEDQIISAQLNGRYKRFADTADFLSTIAIGVESGKLGDDLYEAIGRHVYNVTTHNHIMNDKETTSINKYVDNVFTTLSDRLKSAESNTQTAKEIHLAYRRMLDLDNNENNNNHKILTKERTKQWVEALSSRTDLPPHFLEGVITKGIVGKETKLAYISNPEISASKALDVVSDYKSDVNAEHIPEEFKDAILQKLINMPPEKNFLHQLSPKEVRQHLGLKNFVRTLPVEDFKDLSAKHWIVQANHERYKASHRVASSDMALLLTGEKDGEGKGGRLGELGKWFDDKTKDARIATTREQRPLTEKEEKDLVMTGYVYMTLANTATFEAMNKGKVSSIDPDQYAERIKDLLERSKDSGLAPQKTASGKETMQISFERELNSLIPEKQTTVKEKITEVKAKGLKGLLGKKDKVTEQVKETKALTTEEKKEAKRQLDTQFADAVEKAFYENLALRVNQLHEDMPSVGLQYNSEFSKKSKQVMDRVNDTQIVKNARTEITAAIKTAHELTLHDKEEQLNGQSHTVRYRGDDTSVASYFVERKDVNGDKQVVAVRKHKKENQARNVAMENIRKNKGR